MASFFLAPDPLQSTQFIPGGNTPANGAQLFLYVAQSVSTKQTGFKDNLGSASWTNPIVLDSGGNLPSGGSLWFLAGQTYKAVLAPFNDTDPPTSPYWTRDNLAGINDTTATQTEWQPGPAPTFVSASQFTLVGDQTMIFTKSRRLKFAVTAGTVYGAVSSVSFGGGLTTVNVAFASGALDSGLSVVSYSLLSPDLPSINFDYVSKQASTVASAGNGTTNIWGIAGNSAHVTGTNTIFNFSTSPYSGAARDVIFDGILTLVNHPTNLLLPGNVNVSTGVGDSARIYADGVSTKVLSFTKASVSPFTVATAFLGSTNANSSNTNQLSWTGTYKRIKIYYNNVVPTSNGQNLSARFSGDGVNYDAGSNYLTAVTYYRTTGTAVTASNGTSRAFLAINAESSASFGVNGIFEFMDATSTFPVRSMTGGGVSREPAASTQAMSFGASWTNASSNVQGVQFFFESGSTATGVFSAYGTNNA